MEIKSLLITRDWTQRTLTLTGGNFETDVQLTKTTRIILISLDIVS